jgi:4-amino-4-deoxy-L-arabinose transferase-like glycosyltransferase
VTRYAWRPVGAVAVIVAAVLAVLSDRYGYHRDELYFRVLAAHPAWGYVDQPPLTPMLAKVSIAVFGDHLWSLRIPALLCAVAAILLTALLARELGGGTSAQVLAAVGSCSVYVFMSGHILLTISVDNLVWLLVLLFAIRALLRDQPKWWLAVGLVVGLGLWNKELVGLLLIGLAVGLLISGPRKVFMNRWLWTGVAIAAVVGAPNVVYQITHGWPEITMARAIDREYGVNFREVFVVYQVILFGLMMVPIWIAGLVRLFRAPEWRPIRALAWAYLVDSALVELTGGQPYYTYGLLATLLAAGCVVTARWMNGHRLRTVVVVAALILNVLDSVANGLPVWSPPNSPLAPAAVISAADSDSIGWPRYVSEIAGVYDSLPPSDRARAVVVTADYGEYGAIMKYGRQYHLPTVYSGANELYRFGPPPESATVAVMVGMYGIRGAGLFDSCVDVKALDNGEGVDNEEQGQMITVCRGPRNSWKRLWPEFHHFG